MNSTLDQKYDFTSCELSNFLSKKKKNVGHCSPQYPNELKEGRMTRARERGTERENKNMNSF